MFKMLFKYFSIYISVKRVYFINLLSNNQAKIGRDWFDIVWEPVISFPCGSGKEFCERKR